MYTAYCKFLWRIRFHGAPPPRPSPGCLDRASCYLGGVNIAPPGGSRRLSLNPSHMLSAAAATSPPSRGVNVRRARPAWGTLRRRVAPPGGVTALQSVAHAYDVGKVECNTAGHYIECTKVLNRSISPLTPAVKNEYRPRAVKLPPAGGVGRRIPSCRCLVPD